MHVQFLPLLCDPATKEPLEIEITEQRETGFIVSGVLSTSDGKHVYPIIGGVPRFVKAEGYSDSFGREWEMFSQTQFQNENVAGPMKDHTQKMFAAITEWDERELKDKTVMEFGCGAGRFLDLVKRCGGFAVGLELSKAADIARKNFGEDTRVLIVQGDILHPPFAYKSMDFGYTIGVLHHTPLPALGFRRLLECVKPGGKVAVCVYPAVDGLYHNPSTYTYRHLINKIKTRYGEEKAYTVALLYSKFAAWCLYPLENLLRRIPKLGQKIVWFLQAYCYPLASLPDRNWRILDTFDAITPTFASTHTPEELRFWFDTFGCKDARQTAWGITSWTAIK